MNLSTLIKRGRLDPILETDPHGIEMLVGWRRKDGSRKLGAFTLRRPQAWIVRGDHTPGVKIVLAERRRQLQWEGFDHERDDRYTAGELARAAQCYEREPEERKMLRMTPEEYRAPENHNDSIEVPESWPWAASWWKTGDRIRDLAKAGALYLAEADRLTRAGEPEKAALVHQQALGCCAGIDNLYRVTPLSPGPHLIGA